MASPLAEPIPVYLEIGSPTETVQEVSDLFAEAALEATVQASWPAPERGLDAWSIVLAIPPIVFFEALLSRAGERTGEAIANFLGRLSGVRSGESRIEIGEPERSPIVVIHMTDGLQAYGSLELALKAAPNGAEIRFNWERQVWEVAG